MKPKIVHLIYNLGVGGTEKMMLNTLPRLSDFDHVICVINRTDAALAEEFRRQNIPVAGLGGFKIFQFREIVKKEKPDLMVTYLIYADLFGRIFGRIFKVKKIVTSIRSTYNEPKYRFWLFLEKITSGMVDRYVAVSQTAKKIYEKELGVPGGKIEVIYNAVDIGQFDVAMDKAAKKKELGLPESHFILGSTGKFRPEKGQEYLVWAMPEILKKFPDTTLVLVGGGGNKEKLAGLTKSTGVGKNLLLLDERRDIPEILRTFDVFLNPSFYEGMSNSILEAMASKIPVIASDIPSNSELIENGKTGLLVPAMKSEKISEAVIKILSEPNFGKNLADAAFVKVQDFSIEKTVEKLDNFFHQILNQ